MTLSPTHTLKSPLFPFAMHTCTQSMPTWHSVYGTVSTKYYSITKHEISLKKIRWRHQKCYIVSPLFQKLQLHQWGCYNKYIICFQQPVLAITCPTDDVFKRKPSLLILGNSLDLHLVLFCCIILYSEKNTSGTVNHLFISWMGFYQIGFKEETECSELEALVYSMR